MSAMPLMIGVLCVMAIAYRYYSAFLAAKVAVLDDTRETPAYRHDDGQNYHPTSKWVLFGHHFAAISGAGPLIGPVLAAQFGYMPGLLWIVIGVCLAGAVQDFLVLAASTRREGRSLAQIAFHDVGSIAGTASMLAILGIIIVALAGLGIVVVKALGGEEVTYGATRVELAEGVAAPAKDAAGVYQLPEKSSLVWKDGRRITFNESFPVKTAGEISFDEKGAAAYPADAKRLVPGSSWGTFTIACTIPIALFVGLYMYKIRRGRIIEASVIGATLTLAATVAGGWVAQHAIGRYFNLSGQQVIWSMAAYGFVASVLPVWVLLCPRDYLSSFLKIGTIGLLVGGVIIANPKLEAPATNPVFYNGGPVVGGQIFPFLFITVMCGAISGFHALVSSGTTPKMIRRESHARPIGYGAMLIEGLVGVTAMIAAATLPVGDYYAMNATLADAPKWHDQFVQIGATVDHLNVYEDLTQESLRGRVGGAVTLAVGMAHIFDQAAAKFALGGEQFLRAMWKYWYHFAIMFEALFILTTIDTGTRIGRFLLQELFGKVERVVHGKDAEPRWGRADWWPSAVLSTALIVFGWAWFMQSGSFAVIWKVFGIANQMLAVIALAIVSVYLVNEGRQKYLWVTLLPMCVVCTTTTTAAVLMLKGYVDQIVNQMGLDAAVRNHTLLVNSFIQAALIVGLLTCTLVILVMGAIRIWRVMFGEPPVKAEASVTAGTA
jgi:carbon starvation protein